MPDRKRISRLFPARKFSCASAAHHFSTESVDNSVSKLFSQAANAVKPAFVTDWLKTNQ
jgi:hypothetical protein